MMAFRAFLLVELSTFVVASDHIRLRSLKIDLEAARDQSKGMIPARKTIEMWTLQTYALTLTRS